MVRLSARSRGILVGLRESVSESTRQGHRAASESPDGSRCGWGWGGRGAPNRARGLRRISAAVSDSRSHGAARPVGGL